MAIALTCTCGAFLEVDDRFAGQMIQCPDCGRPLQAAPGEKLPLRTSGWAIASLFASLAGALTLVGPLLGVAAGGLALRSIRKHPDRLAGRGYALAGIVLGFVFSVVSGLALLAPDMLGIDLFLHSAEWAGKLDFSVPLEVKTYRGFFITRPSSPWGLSRGQPENDPEKPQAILSSDQVMLVNVREDAHAIGFLMFKTQVPIDEQDSDRKTALDAFARSELLQLIARRRRGAATQPVEVVSSKMTADDGREVQELVVDVQPGKQPRSFVMRIIRGGDDIFVIAAGARKSRFADLEKELRKLIEGFKIKR
jgi:hypothetical protein